MARPRFRFVLWMVIGIVVYVTYSRRHSVLGRRERGEEASVTTPAGGPSAPPTQPQ